MEEERKMLSGHASILEQKFYFVKGSGRMLGIFDFDSAAPGCHQ
jgi:hypothetical protein